MTLAPRAPLIVDSFGEAAPTASQTSVCQVAELRLAGDALVCHSDAEFDFALPSPEATTTARRSVTSS